MSGPILVSNCKKAITLAAVLLGSSIAIWSQQQPTLSYTTSPAIDQAHSRAEQEAEETVSLSADKIVSILQEETGLLLQVKKALVRRAFEQGRVLDANDLTDEAVFRLIQADPAVRVIATREIEDRQYIRAKPTREELARNLPCRAPIPAGKDAKPTEQPDSKRVLSQEQQYWTLHESDLDCDLTKYLPGGTAQSLYETTNPPVPNQPPQPLFPSQQPPYPQLQNPYQQYPQQTYPPSQGAPQSQPPDYRRQLEMTQLQYGDYFGLDADESQMAAIQPGELPTLLNANQTDGSSTLFRKGMPGAESSVPGTGVSGLTLPPSLGSSGSSPLASLTAGRRELAPQPPRLENQMRPQVPYYIQPKPNLQPKLRHPPNPYADVPSLYDLYAQYSRRSLRLERFGEDVFRNGTGNSDELPMDMPAGPDYVVGPGDGLTIILSGGISQRLQRIVDREGRVALPEVGAVEVAGRNLGDVQHIVRAALRGEFRDVDADVSLARIRTVRVYVVGDVERPGAYDVSSLSTPLNALFVAGGPTSAGSLRLLEHYRGKERVQEVDVYDLLLHGITGNLQRLEAGDTIVVPPLKGEVTVEGMVRRPAIYELNEETNLAEVLQLAGGVLPTGTLRHVDLERIESHESRTMLRLDIPETNNQQQVTQALEDFKVQVGDKVKITPILPYTEKTVYLDGYVSRPGKFAYTEGMKVTDLIKSYKDVLPEPSNIHAEIIRLNAPDYTPVVLAFNLGDALAGKDQDLILKPFDTVRVFSKYDFEDPPIVTISGEVRDPGDHLTNGLPHLRDAIYLAGGTTHDALLDDVQIYRKTSNGNLEVLSVNLGKALAGDQKYNIMLQPKDRVFVQRDLNKVDPPMVSIEGQVARPGKYPLGENMTAAGLVQLAGGFKRGAYTEEADLTRYEVEQGTRVVSDHVNVPIAKAMQGEADADVRLRDGDVLTIGEISGWQDLGATIQVLGEVAHPGGYGIQPGERLSSVIARAGGFLPTAYPYGAIFERVELRELEEKNRADLIERIKAEAKTVKLVPEMDADDQAQAKATVLQYKRTIENLQNTPPAGRLVIHISSDIQHWQKTQADVQLRPGDKIYIPKRPSMVVVDGSVYNPTGITYKPGKNAGWYLQQAGGPTAMANKKGTFVIRADGSIAGGPGGLLSGGVEGTEMRPGDMVVVPEQIYSFSNKFKSTMAIAQIAASIGSAIAISAYYATH
ncbi:MAG TPA: SLBB domain-containing protein [Terriglobales bacterium]|nr:SLBB domain-containing protein [Terriglobales bacterium]